MNKKSYSLILAASVFTAGMFAQNIELPEVTTVISGETEKAGNDVLPDFSDILKLPVGSGGVEPKLPEVESSDTTDIVSGKSKPVQKSVYAEGLIGGGYPGFFTGNISVARTVGANPFKVSFEHDTALKYAKHSVTEGYSDRTTKLAIEKEYHKNNLFWGASGSYKSASDGLQGNVINPVTGAVTGLLNRDLYQAAGNIKYSFENGFSVGGAAKAGYFNRYADVPCFQIYEVGFCSVEPQIMFRWKGHGFDTGFTTDYSYETELKDNILFPKSHRVKFTIDLQWKNDVIRLYGNAAAVIGKNLMEKTVIVPFTVGVDSSFPVYFSNRRVSICAEGGIDSNKPKTYELEEKYKFTNLNYNTTEVSEWYGRFNLIIPIKTSFTGTASAEYRQTAYDNARWQPDYEGTCSIYGYRLENFRGLSTDLGVSYRQGIISVSGSWHSNWLDVSFGENMQKVKFDINIEEEASKWGADFNCELPINDKIETPVVNAEGFISLTPSVRAILSLNDIIKLYKGETRTYAGKYVARGGSAAMLLKFVF